MRRYVGVDLHNNMFVVCFFDETGIKNTKTYAMRELKQFREELNSEDEVAVETTTNTRYFIKNIQDVVKKVHVVNPHQFKVISQSVKKTDKKDAELIAEFLSKGLLPEIRMKDENYQKIESLAHTRDKLVKLRTVLKNKIHNILRSEGIETKKEFLSGEKMLEKVLEYKTNEIAKVELKVIVDQIKSLNQGISEIDKELKEKGEKLEGYKNITSIDGIGSKSGTILLSIIGDIDDFESRKKLDAYFGIVPRVNQSNEKIQYGRITKQGNKLGRTTLVQCTLIAIQHSEYLKRYYIKMKHKKGTGKAIIATARKLLGVIYYTLKEKLEFEDFSQFILKTV